jgi:small subunit ribosomal protein S4
VGDVVQVRERSRKMNMFTDALDAIERRGLPNWIELDRKEMKATVKAFPSREDITMPIQEQMIVELYSK